MEKKKKVKRKINGRFVALLAAIILVALSIYKIPHFINTNKLSALGYDDEAISAIYKKGLRSTILKNEYYSIYLNDEVKKDDFNAKYIKLYTLTDELNEDYFNLYEKLKTNKGYNDEELETLYSNLNYVSLRPLLIFDKLESLDDYIDDCLAHPDNTESNFVLSGDYLHPYENVTEIEDKSAIDAFVSVKTTLGEYEPEKLVNLSTYNAISGNKLQSTALSAFEEMSDAIRETGHPIYARAAYISYAEQKELHTDNNKQIKEGFSDAQTGLAVYVVETGKESTAFKDTEAYKWLIENSYKYGFILRYPEGKEEFTGHSASYDYFRYVGKDLAKEIHDSGLSFDEYYYYVMN